MEIRNGSDKAIQQLVWGLGYIDELVQVSHNLAPTLSHNNCTRHFYAMQDATPGPRSPSFAIGRAENVMGLVEESGRLVERYEYTPYGRRQVFAQPWYRADFDRDGDVDAFDLGLWQAGNGDPDGDGSSDGFDKGIYDTEFGSTAYPNNDTLVMHPRPMSFRQPVTQTLLCAFGHQGLLHDEDVGDTATGAALVYNRARMLHPGLGRFVQRDPLKQNESAGGYQDGLSVYQYLKSDPTNLSDWPGTQAVHNAACYKRCHKQMVICVARTKNYGLCSHTEHACLNDCAQQPPQDGLCTIPGVGPIYDKDPLFRSCCMLHDKCYEAHGCTSKSFFGEDQGSCCDKCNDDAKDCFIHTNIAEELSVYTSLR